VIKKKIPFIKNTKISTPKYPQTRNRWFQKMKIKTNLEKKPRAIQFIQKVYMQTGSIHTWTQLNTDNSENSLQSREWIDVHFKNLFFSFLGLSASIPSFHE
jgi:hypothetical protein